MSEPRVFRTVTTTRVPNEPRNGTRVRGRDGTIFQRVGNIWLQNQRPEGAASDDPRTWGELLARWEPLEEVLD